MVQSLARFSESCAALSDSQCAGNGDHGELAVASIVNAVLATIHAQEWYLARCGQVYSIHWKEVLFSRCGRAVTLAGFVALAIRN